MRSLSDSFSSDGRVQENGLKPEIKILSFRFESQKVYMLRHGLDSSELFIYLETGKRVNIDSRETDKDPPNCT